MTPKYLFFIIHFMRLVFFYPRKTLENFLFSDIFRVYNKNRQAVWNWFILKFNFVFSKFTKRYFHIWFRITSNKIKPSFKNTIPKNLNLLELLNEADKTFLLPDFDIDFFIFDGSLELCIGETISRKRKYKSLSYETI